MERDQGLPDEFDAAIPGGLVAGAPEGIGEAGFDDFPEPERLELGLGLDSDPSVEFRRTLGMFVTGVTIITVRVGEQVHGMTANAFMSVSLRPPLVLISVDRRAKMHTLLHEGMHYGISVLADEQELLSDHFAGRAGAKGAEAQFALVRGTPLVEGALAHLVARVVRSYWGGDHSLFLGQVEYVRYGEGTPLLFHGGRYERLIDEVAVSPTLAPELLRPILAAGEERNFADGEAIVSSGEPGEELFFVLEGAARVERDGRVLRRVAAGELFGELAVLDGRERSADVIAVGPVRCLAVHRDALREALELEPRAAWEMLRILAGRFRRAE